jgi:hypothetical protein
VHEGVPFSQVAITSKRWLAPWLSRGFHCEKHTLTEGTQEDDIAAMNALGGVRKQQSHGG